MTDLSMQRALDEALGDFAERRGKLFFKQIVAEHGENLRQGGRFIAIDALSGGFFHGDTMSAALKAVRQKFGDRSVSWIVDLDEARCRS